MGGLAVFKGKDMTTLVAEGRQPVQHHSKAARRRKSRFFLAAPILPGFKLSFGWGVFYISVVLLLPVVGLLYYVHGLTSREDWHVEAGLSGSACYTVTFLS